MDVLGVANLMGVDQEFDQDIMGIHGISSSNEIYSWSENMVPHNGWSSCFVEIASVFLFLLIFRDTPALFRDHSLFYSLGSPWLLSAVVGWVPWRVGLAADHVSSMNCPYLKVRLPCFPDVSSNISPQ